MWKRYNIQYVLLAPNKSPSVQSVFQANQEKVSQSVVENVPKARCVKVNDEIST